MMFMETEPPKTKSLKIIGTAHVSQRSIEEVRETILEMEPDVVAVELDINRYHNLKNRENGEKPEKAR